MFCVYSGLRCRFLDIKQPANFKNQLENLKSKITAQQSKNNRLAQPAKTLILSDIGCFGTKFVPLRLHIKNGLKRP
jgi:hypothetical protein